MVRKRLNGPEQAVKLVLFRVKKKKYSIGNEWETNLVDTFGTAAKHNLKAIFLRYQPQIRNKT